MATRWGYVLACAISTTAVISQWTTKTNIVICSQILYWFSLFDDKVNRLLYLIVVHQITQAKTSLWALITKE